MMPIAFDTETYYDGTYSVSDLGPRKYAEHTAFECYLISVCDGEQTWVGAPNRFNWGAVGGQLLLSHNAYFDQTILEQMMSRNQVALGKPWGDWHCTADLASYICSVRSLKDAVRNLYNVDLSKAERNFMCGKRWAELTEEQRKSVREYARRDAFWCWKIWHDYSAKWPELERTLSQLTRTWGRHGVAIDSKKLFTWNAAVHAYIQQIEKELPWIECGYSPSSPKGIADQCIKSGIPVPLAKSTDEEAYEEWEETFGPDHPWIHKVGEWRSATKVRSTLETMCLRLADEVSGARSIEAPLKYFGGHTGRWSGDGGVNFQNFRKKPFVVAGAEIDIRHLTLPRPGKKMIIADLSQIEPRVLWWLAGDFEALDMVAKGMSPYEAHARATMGWTGDVDLKAAAKLDKKAAELYSLCKARILALGFGCGWKKFITMASFYGLVIEEKQSRAIVEEFRSSNPKVTGLWHTLEEAFRNSAGRGTFEVKMPSGRSLLYRDVKRSIFFEDDEKEPGKKIRRVKHTAIVRGKRSNLYGGKLTENLVQALARDVFAEGVIRLHKAGYRVLFTVHDEVVLEVEPTADVRHVESLMSVTPSWLPGCPIRAEGSLVDYYQKL